MPEQKLYRFPVNGDSARSVLPLRLEDVHLARQQTRILNGINLSIDAGGFVVMLGFNGAGKSVLLRLINGLLQPDRGRVHWQTNLTTADLHRRQSLVFQRPIMLRRSVRENLLYPLKVHGYDRNECEERLQSVMQIANLGALADRPARVLSGGELQRVAIARALGTGPELLMLDEPTSNLDPASTAAIESLLSEVHGRGTTILMVTQSPGQARRMAREIVFMHEGTVIEHCAATRFFNAPRSPVAQAYLAGRLPLDVPNHAELEQTQ